MEKIFFKKFIPHILKFRDMRFLVDFWRKSKAFNSNVSCGYHEVNHFTTLTSVERQDIFARSVGQTKHFTNYLLEYSYRKIYKLSNAKDCS